MKAKTKKKTLFYKMVKFYEEKRGFTKIGAREYAKKNVKEHGK